MGITVTIDTAITVGHTCCVRKGGGEDWGCFGEARLRSEPYRNMGREELVFCIRDTAASL
jgi:hypothetical protein